MEGNGRRLYPQVRHLAGGGDACQPHARGEPGVGSELIGLARDSYRGSAGTPSHSLGHLRSPPNTLLIHLCPGIFPRPQAAQSRANSTSRRSHESRRASAPGRSAVASTRRPARRCFALTVHVTVPALRTTHHRLLAAEMAASRAARKAARGTSTWRRLRAKSQPRCALCAWRSCCRLWPPSAPK